MATIFPGTLMPMSVYAFVRGLSAIVVAPAVGMYIDTENRLQVVRVSIGFPPGSAMGLGLLLAATLLACFEKLCSIMNLVSVEKDWVVVVAEKDPEALRIINAQMRRIDLLCKLLGPLFIALIDGYSSEVAIIVNFAMNAASAVVEYFAIARVYWQVPELQKPKQEHWPSFQSGSSQDFDGLGRRSWQRLKTLATRSATDFTFYFNHRAFLPSFAGPRQRVLRNPSSTADFPASFIFLEHCNQLQQAIDLARVYYYRLNEAAPCGLYKSFELR
ncbi:hypothetical protein Neosp_012179 [[Neocosmospora] mangrovei]